MCDSGTTLLRDVHKAGIIMHFVNLMFKNLIAININAVSYTTKLRLIKYLICMFIDINRKANQKTLVVESGQVNIGPTLKVSITD